MTKRLHGKVVVVTGAAGGQGAAESVGGTLRYDCAYGRPGPLLRP